MNGHTRQSAQARQHAPKRGLAQENGKENHRNEQKDSKMVIDDLSYAQPWSASDVGWLWLVSSGAVNTWRHAFFHFKRERLLLPKNLFLTTFLSLKHSLLTKSQQRVPLHTI